MLKHASPNRSASSLATHLVSGPVGRPSDVSRGGVAPTRCGMAALRDSFSERSVDCDSIIVPSSYADAERAVGYQVGTWSGVSQACVRRGLSFTARRGPDSLSFRSVRSEGPPISPDASPSKLPATSASMMNVSALKDDLADTPKASSCLKGDMTTLKNLLRLRAPTKVLDVTKSSVATGSPDTLSLNSADSFFSPNNSGRTSSRSWSSNASSNSNTTSSSTGSNNSNNSASEPASTTIKVFAKCLRSDIEYKTISVSARATCREVVALLLSKYRMRHRDPNLFYLTMEVTVRRWSGAPVRSLLVLEESARPAQLALCRPPGDSRFALQMRRGGVIKVHDTVLMPGSQYKSLLVSDRTTAEEVVQLLLNCYNRRENKAFYALHEVRRSPEYSDRVLMEDERPLQAKAKWPRDRQAEYVFVLRRNMSQALSLRKLSLRTSDKNSASCGQCCATFSRPPTAPPAQTLVLEEAVIDCTEVMPKMTTFSRMAPVASARTVAIFSTTTAPSMSAILPTAASISASSLPMAPSASSSSSTLPATSSASSSSSTLPAATSSSSLSTSSSSPLSKASSASLSCIPMIPSTTYSPVSSSSTLTVASSSSTSSCTSSVCSVATRIHTPATVSQSNTITTTTTTTADIHQPPTTTDASTTTAQDATTSTTKSTKPVPAPRTLLVTAETGTNTEVKTWSHSSTQTALVGRRGNRSASVSCEPRHAPLPRHASEPHLHLVGEKAALDIPVTSLTPEKSELSTPVETPTRTPTTRRFLELLQHTPLYHTPLKRCNGSRDLLDDSYLDSPTCFNQSLNTTVLQRHDDNHTCQRNCQHCFYI